MRSPDDWSTLLPILARVLERADGVAPAWVSARTRRLARQLCGALADDIAQVSRAQGGDAAAEAVTGIDPRRLSEWRGKAWLPPVER